MNFRKLAELLCLVIIIAALGCDSRSDKPAPAIPKKTPKVEESWPEINRAEVEAAQREPQRPPQRAPEPAASPAAPIPQVVESKPVEPVPDGSGSLPWLDADGSQLPMEYWEVQYFNAQRIGITRYRIEAAGRGLKIRIETNMQIALPDRLMRQTIVIDTTEQLDGRMEQFSETLNSDAGSSTTDATVNFGELRLVNKNGKKHIAWPDGSWGPMGIHQLLMRKPMKPGEVRQAKVFLPQLHQLALVTLRAGKPEDTTSPDGLLANVTPIDVIMQLEKEGIRVKMWTDAAGRVQKTIWPQGLNLISFRISSEVARRLQSEVDIESYRGVTLAYTATDAVTAEQSQVQYEVTSEQADPHTLFSPESNQSVRAKSVYETLITVFRPAWQGSAPAEVRQTAPSLKELSGSNWLPTDGAAVRRLAEQWGGTATDPSKWLGLCCKAFTRICGSSSSPHRFTRWRQPRRTWRATAPNTRCSWLRYCAIDRSRRVSPAACVCTLAMANRNLNTICGPKPGWAIIGYRWTLPSAS